MSTPCRVGLIGTGEQMGDGLVMSAVSTGEGGPASVRLCGRVGPRTGSTWNVLTGQPGAGDFELSHSGVLPDTPHT